MLLKSAEEEGAGECQTYALKETAASSASTHTPTTLSATLLLLYQPHSYYSISHTPTSLRRAATLLLLYQPLRYYSISP